MKSLHEKLSTALIGVWWLISRIDTAKDGTTRDEPNLGANPLGILTYSPEYFSAQFMRRDRTKVFKTSALTQGQNNTEAVDGYDAYFGTYEVDENTGEVIHKLEGALAQSNVGIKVSRNLKVQENHLEIHLETTTSENEIVTRVLTWKRIG